MTKTEYTAAIEADLTAANALCAELRTLRNFKRLPRPSPTPTTPERKLA